MKNLQLLLYIDKGNFINEFTTRCYLVHNFLNIFLIEGNMCLCVRMRARARVCVCVGGG